MNYWLAKTDPETYAIDNLEKDKKTTWDGVRNYEARNNLKNMEVNDVVLIFHSQKEKAIVGIATVSKTSFQDPTTDDNQWVAVEFKYAGKINPHISLSEIKSHPVLQNMRLVKHTRLSVIPITMEEYSIIIELSKNKQ